MGSREKPMNNRSWKELGSILYSKIWENVCFYRVGKLPWGLKFFAWHFFCRLTCNQTNTRCCLSQTWFYIPALPRDSHVSDMYKYLFVEREKRREIFCIVYAQLYWSWEVTLPWSHLQIQSHSTCSSFVPTLKQVSQSNFSGFQDKLGSWEKTTSFNWGSLGLVWSHFFKGKSSFLRPCLW